MNYSDSELLTIQKFINDVEEDHLRTVHDTAAHEHTLYFWNMVRSRAKLPRVWYHDLPAYCIECKGYHKHPHEWQRSAFDSDAIALAIDRWRQSKEKRGV